MSKVVLQNQGTPVPVPATGKTDVYTDLSTKKLATQDDAGVVTHYASTVLEHSHANKALLDTYTQLNADIADAVSKKHDHSNLTILNNTSASFTMGLQSTYDGYATSKENTIAAGTTAQYWRGDKSWQSFPSTGGAISSLSSSLAFTAETYKDFDITLTTDSVILALGRLYIDANPGAGFYDAATLCFYNNSARDDDHIIFMANIPVVYTTFAAGALAGASSITATDTSKFVNADLMYLFGTLNEFRRISSIASTTLNLMTILDNSYNLGDGVSNVSEFGNLVLFDTTGAKKIYGRLTFTAAKTVNVKVDLVVRS